MINEFFFQTAAIFWSIFLSLSLILQIIGLIGIIIENKFIVIIYLSLALIKVIFDIMRYGFGYGLIIFVIALLTAIYASMLVKANRSVFIE
jgi:hypothetical protein